MQVLNRSKQSLRPPRARHGSDLMQGGFLLALVLLSSSAHPQTLARPGWAGSGMTAEQWWPHAVICDVQPDSLAVDRPAGDGSTLHRLASRLEDMQTLGVDALLLRDLESDPQTELAGERSNRGAIAIDERYGNIEQFDDFVRDAVRHGMRVLVELRPGTGAASSLTDDARFWLNHGVTGLSLRSDDAAEVRAVRSVLRSYVGERVLIAETEGSPPSSGSPASARSTRIPAGGMSLRSSAASPARPDQPDLARIDLPPVAQGAAEMRRAIEGAQSMVAGHGPLPLLSAPKQDGGLPARVMATLLLGSGGAVLLRADDLDLAHGAGGGTPSSVFAWYRQWSGLHRGNAQIRSGVGTLPDHDADGALVWVRHATSVAPIIGICNLTAKPLRLSLVDDVRRLKLRGSFLRTVARSDGGMGAMPLRDVTLPAFGVYVGELSR